MGGPSGEQRGRSRPGCRRGCGCCGGCLLALLALALGLLIYALVPNRYPPLPAAPTAQSVPAAGGHGLPWLHSDGRMIVDPEGREVLLRGMDVVSLLHPAGTAGGRLPAPAAFATMAADGFDVIRAPITWAGIEPRPGRFSAPYLARIRELVDRAAAAGLYTVLDLHDLDWSRRYGGDGAPAWATAGPLPTSFPAPPPWDRHLAPGVLASYGIFWADWGGWQRDVIASWRYVARAFARDPAVCAFDLWNEPHPFPAPPGLFAKKLLLPFEARLITSLATVAPRQMWMTEQTLDFGLPTYVGRLPYPNQVFSSHVFATLLDPPWDLHPAAEYASPLRLLEAQARTAHAAPWVGEFGGPPSRGATTWIDRELGEFDRFEMGWAYWAWSQVGSWSAATHPARLRALARPYPRAVPGTLTAVRFDPAARRLTVAFTGRSGGRPTLVAVPARFTRYRLTTSDPAGAVTSRLEPRRHLLAIVIQDRDRRHTLVVTLRP